MRPGINLARYEAIASHEQVETGLCSAEVALSAYFARILCAKTLQRLYIYFF